MKLETIYNDENVSAQLSRDGVRFLIGERHFVIWDTKTEKPVEFITYDRVYPSGSSSQSASVFIDLTSELPTEEIRIVIQPQEKVIHLVKQQYEEEFETFLSQLQLRKFQSQG